MILCDCVSVHSPSNRAIHRHHVWPMGMGGPDEEANLVVVCPNLHANTHMLIRMWGIRYDGEPPWWVQRQFSVLARILAAKGWTAWDEAGRPVDRQRWIYQGARAAHKPLP